MKKLFLSLIIVTMVVSSCTNYEDGPGISIIPKTMRLTREWSPEKKFKNDVEQTLSTSEADDYIEFTKENDFAVVFVDGATETRAEGTWQWRNDHQDIEVNYTWSIFSMNETYTIKRLTTKELWYSYTDDVTTDIYEYHMIARD